MVTNGIGLFRNKNILFLQGPLGPFFKNLQLEVDKVASNTYKINFNGGDWIFSPKSSVNFTGKVNEWGPFFESFLLSHKIDFVVLFGDCRIYHRIAHEISIKHNIDVGVFEEGYIRPDFITFEKNGVNGFSFIPRNRQFYDSIVVNNDKYHIHKVGNSFKYSALWAIVYYFFSTLLKPLFLNYRHHRPLHPFEGLFWIRSWIRKYIYKNRERGIYESLIGSQTNKYFLVPLQISTDVQITQHSSYHDINSFIEEVMYSFAKYSCVDDWLVIKHHPMDRGYNDYTKLIYKLANILNIKDRVVYIHDQHLPTLLDHTKGVVLINSTVGLSALHHKAPTKVCGTAIYDFDGLTYQGSLDDFWTDASEFELDYDLYEKFKYYIISKYQLNGNFYKKLDIDETIAGINWSK